MPLLTDAHSVLIIYRIINTLASCADSTHAHTHTHTHTHARTRTCAHILMFKCWQTAVLSFGFHEKLCILFSPLAAKICGVLFAACGKKNWGFCFRRLRRKFWGLLFMQHETAGGNQPERALGLRLGFWVVSSLRYMIYIYT